MQSVLASLRQKGRLSAMHGKRSCLILPALGDFPSAKAKDAKSPVKVFIHWVAMCSSAYDPLRTIVPFDLMTETYCIADE